MLNEVLIAQPIAQATFATSPDLFFALINSADIMLVLQNCIADPLTVVIFFGMRRNCYSHMLIPNIHFIFVIHPSTTTDRLSIRAKLNLL